MNCVMQQDTKYTIGKKTLNVKYVMRIDYIVIEKKRERSIEY